MESRVDYRRTRYAVFFLLAVTINIIDGAITRSVSDASKRTLVAAAASVDLIVVVSAIYYWLLVRVGIRSRESLIPIFLLGVLHASLLYPNARAVTAWIGGLCEAGLIGFVLVQVRRQTRRMPGSPEVDPLDAMQAALESVFPNSVARVGAVELSIFYYALFSWRAAPFVPRGAQGFSLHRESGQADLLYVLAIASLAGC